MDKKAFEKYYDQVINVPYEEPGPEEIGPEETIESIEGVFDCFPPQVQISNCHDCTFNIYPTNNKWVNGEVNHE